MAARGPIQFCFSAVRWIPVLFITAIIAWSYYAYVIQMVAFTIDSTPEKIILALIYHPILVLFLWAYWQAIFTPPGKPSREFYLSPTEEAALNREDNESISAEIFRERSKNLPVYCRSMLGEVRCCYKCYCIKPDRCHHCSVCGHCVLKMDHHCPWINNCVGYTNYKFFVLFLFYALLYCFYVASSSLKYFISFWQGGSDSNKGMGRFHILFLFFASIMFAVSLISLFSYHIYLTLYNRSTLESFRTPHFQSGPDKDAYNLGRSANFKEVFGENKYYWALPIFTSAGDGIVFPMRVSSQNGTNYHTMEAPPVQQDDLDQSVESKGDGTNFPIRTIDEDYDSLLGQRQRWMEEGGNEAHDNNAMNTSM